MKDKRKKRKKELLILLAGAIFSAVAFYLVDEVAHGAILDWFGRTFMIEYDTGTGINYMPDWTSVKWLCQWLLIASVVFWLSIIMITVSIQSRKAKQEAVTETTAQISRMMHTYMTKDLDASEIFEGKYPEISIQMVEVKAEMIRKEQILKDEAARKSDLITYLAHDLKTPLTSVIGYLSLLDEAPDMPAKQKAKYVHISLDKALRLEKLINEFFEITRYNLQQIHLETETIDLSYMLVQMADEFYPILKAHGNTIEIKAKEDLHVHADAMKLARVFNNILKNAVAYSYPGSVIKIVAESTEKEVRILFQNKGKTISKQKLDMLFEKFFRLDDARATNTGGAGLGLAIAKEIVTLHGGTIAADSEEETTTFTVTLPI